MVITFSDAESRMRTARNGSRKLANNTYLVPRGADAYAVRLHSTDIITIHRDGTFTLNTGGWDTVITKDRLNSFGPARIYSERGTWAVWHSSDPRTPAKIQRCRSCRGVGRVRQAGYRTYYDWTSGSGYRQIFPPRITMPRYVKCWHCDGTGQRDYGSKAMPVMFFDSIRVDGEGRVVDPAGRQRLHEPADVKAAREAVQLAAREAAHAAAVKAQRGRRRAWLAEHGVRTGTGVAYMFKAVRDDLASFHGARYVPGETVMAADYLATAECGNGLHFSPTAADARKFDGAATRFLLCAVDRKTMIILNDYVAPKVKARSCKVLHEVDANGNRIGLAPDDGVT